MFIIKPVTELLEECKVKFNHISDTKTLLIEESLDYVMAEDVYAGENIPQFNKSTVDGYAVIASDTFGCSENMPNFLTNISEIFMGTEATLALGPGQCQRIATGGMLPPNSDAVIMQEYTERMDDLVTIYRSMGPWENVIRVGEDLSESDMVFAKGHKIRPQDIGILASIGKTEILVYKQLKIAVISTGDELVEPSVKDLGIAQIRDINGYAVRAQLQKENYQVDYHGIIKDNYQTIKAKVNDLYDQYDCIILSGGSSVGTKDVTVDIIEELADVTILSHGLAVKPGKPTIIAKSQDKLIVGLPGHPVSAMVILQNVILPILRNIQGIKDAKYQASIQAYITHNIDSQTGRMDVIRVRLEKGQDGKLYAKPMLGKAGVFSSLIKADGYIIINEPLEGIAKGKEVEVFLF